MEDRALGRRVAVNTAAQIAGRAVIVGLAAVSIAVITRYLGPSSYGRYALALSYIQLFGVLADVGLFTIVVREISKRPEQTSRLVGNAMTLRALVSVVVVLLALGVSLLLPYTPQVRVAILIAAVPFVLGLLSTSLVTVFQAQLRMERSVIADVIGRASALAAVVVVVVADLGFYAVVASAAVGAAVTLALTATLVRPLAAIRFAAEPAVWRMLITAALPLGIALTLNEVYFRADTLIISLYKSDRQVGLYALAWRVYELVALFPAVIMTSVFPLLSRYVETDEGRARRLLQGAADMFWAVGLPLAAGGVVLAPGIVQLAGGSGFAASAEPLQLLLPAGALAYVNGLFGYALIAKNRQRDALWLNVVGLVLNLGLNFALVPSYGIVAAAAVTLGCEIVILGGSWLLMRTHYRFFPSLVGAGKALLAALVMAAVLWPLRHGPVLPLIALGAAVYAAVLFAVGGVDRELIGRLRG
ncbi:MAG TPA: flippase [Solirubrobacteraceae bacterium]|nr:flippase [Solirubrobacteraceae bacterium]